MQAVFPFMYNPQTHAPDLQCSPNPVYGPAPHATPDGRKNNRPLDNEKYIQYLDPHRQRVFKCFNEG